MHAQWDVHRRIEYRRDFTRILAMSLGGICLSLLLFATGSLQGITALAAWLMLAIGGGGIAWTAWRAFFDGRPVLALSPEGIVWNGGIGEIPIPWSEVQGVETETYTVVGRTNRGTYRQRFENTTMVLVTREFYDRNIDPGSDFMRGPYWNWIMRPKGELVQIALLHEQLGVHPRDVREPIEARWKAFGSAGGAQPQRASPNAAPMRFGGGVHLNSPLQLVIVAVPLAVSLLVVGNIAGVWETPGQKDARIQREERAAQDRRLNEQIERHFKAQEEMWERVNATRHFGNR